MSGHGSKSRRVFHGRWRVAALALATPAPLLALRGSAVQDTVFAVFGPAAASLCAALGARRLSVGEVESQATSPLANNPPPPLVSG